MITLLLTAALAHCPSIQYSAPEGAILNPEAIRKVEARCSLITSGNSPCMVKVEYKPGSNHYSAICGRQTRGTDNDALCKNCHATDTNNVPTFPGFNTEGGFETYLKYQWGGGLWNNLRGTEDSGLRR